MTTETKQGPVKTFKAGAISASVWENEVDRDGRRVVRYSVTIEKRYRNRADEWQTSHTYFANDIPRLRLVLAKAYEYMAMRRDAQE